jgi:hypothetical protein
MRILSYKGILWKIILMNYILFKYKDLYKIRSFPHTLDIHIFFKKMMWKSCEKFFFRGGNIF